MGSTKLKEDLTNCLINFDRRVLITELLDDYQLAYEEVNDLVEKYVEQQEKKDKIKFDKRFLVHGVVEGEQKKEIYKIVEETKLKEWLNKLKNAESSLYSVEVAGGAKSAAPVFKPMSVQEGAKLKDRQGSKASITNGAVETSKTTKPIEKKEVKQEATSSKALKASPKSSAKATTKVEAKKTSPKTETSPTDKKAADKKSTNKKGINNFFAPTATAANKKTEDVKDSKASSGVVKPPTPKKMEDFFKKQTEKPKTSTESIKKTPAVNTSVQLFDDEDEEEPEEISSDEEEKLEALKRDIISSDVEMEAEDENDTKPTTSSKRRRILDSDDEEEDPPVKQEKLDIKKETKEEEAEEPVAETYLDEDGFVITKKPKQKASGAANKSPATKKTPPVTLKSSPKDSKKPSTTKETKAATNSAAKTKQAGIMNFFSKK
ncbi:uncharacterized protein DDB_G0286299 [Lucilia sericata]|uniref:uncharacterized protein DDB_G0286299 n=1 Tax=Lucilia sericata TaxID=13632 RepID=UPI0018A87F95|nr:uncharacterized protein DDB_G0286299 [Lucilia sericata]